MGLSFVYLDSVLYKISSPIWRGGLGMWFPAMMPYFGNGNMDFLLDYYYVLVPLGYLTLFFESFFFTFLFHRKFWAIPFIVGCGLHVGIALTFTIVNFGLMFSAVFLLFIPDRYIDALFRGKFNYENSQDFVILPKTYIPIIMLFICLQVLPTLSYTPYARRLINNKIKDSLIFRYGRLFSYHLFGITNHPVFMDFHYNNSNYVWRLVDKEDSSINVLVDKNGSPLFEMNGRLWVRFLKISLRGYNEDLINKELIPIILKSVPLYGDSSRTYEF